MTFSTSDSNWSKYILTWRFHANNDERPTNMNIIGVKISKQICSKQGQTEKNTNQFKRA